MGVRSEYIDPNEPNSDVKQTKLHTKSQVDSDWLPMFFLSFFSWENLFWKWFQRYPTLLFLQNSNNN